MDSPNQRNDGALRRDMDWARLQLLRMLVVLVEQIRLGRPIPLEPWSETRPGVRRGGE